MLTFRLVQTSIPISANHVMSSCLTMLKDLTILVEHHAIIRIRDDTSLRVHTGDRLIHPMQGDQGQQGEN